MSDGWLIFRDVLPFKWKYLPGRLNVADPLSRAPQLKGAQADPMVATLTVVQQSTSQPDQLLNGTSDALARSLTLRNCVPLNMPMIHTSLSTATWLLSLLLGA